jgi:hypothetical protein
MDISRQPERALCIVYVVCDRVYVGSFSLSDATRAVIFLVFTAPTIPTVEGVESSQVNLRSLSISLLETTISTLRVPVITLRRLESLASSL